MALHEDSALISIEHNRQVVHQLHNKDWQNKNDSAKMAFRDSIRIVYHLDTTVRVLITTGKQYFYDFEKAFAKFDRGINDFIDNNVDPWYAQAILLIESPNKLQKSNVGAYGPFQLMKEVARMYGLKVNKTLDERADFDRSAFAASSLLKTVCIPNVKQMLDSLKINYSETDLWFRLLVMHTYHAGAGNVRKAVFSFKPSRGGMELIYALWHTKIGQFKTSSQNYSQLVIASMLEMNDRLHLKALIQKE